MTHKTSIKALSAELIGSLILVMFGIGASANAALGPRLPAGAYTWLTVALGWGLGYALATLLVSSGSLAHLNPAVTLALAVRRKFPW